MIPQTQKLKVVALSDDAATIKELRSLLRSCVELIHVRDRSAAEAACTIEPAPYAVLVQIDAPPLPSAAADRPSREELIAFLAATRERHPKIRRIVIAEHCDLSLVINGIHSGVIDSLVYKPLSPLELLAALRPQTARPAGKPDLARTAKAAAAPATTAEHPSLR